MDAILAVTAESVGGIVYFLLTLLVCICALARVVTALGERRWAVQSRVKMEQDWSDQSMEVVQAREQSRARFSGGFSSMEEAKAAHFEMPVDEWLERMYRTPASIKERGRAKKCVPIVVKAAEPVMGPNPLAGMAGLQSAILAGGAGGYGGASGMTGNSVCEGADYPYTTLADELKCRCGITRESGVMGVTCDVCRCKKCAGQGYIMAGPLDPLLCDRCGGRGRS